MKTEANVRVASVADYEAQAKKKLGPVIWDYITGGSCDEITLRENRAAFDRRTIRPRVLTGVTQPELRTSVLGRPVAMPILVAPMAYQRMLHPDGELATARAADAARTLMGISTMSTCSFAEIADAAPGSLRWFQLYALRDVAANERLIKSAEESGCRALVLTVDLIRVGKRERDDRNGFALPPHLKVPNLDAAKQQDLRNVLAGQSALTEHARRVFDDALTWDTIDQLRSWTALPLVIKGILTAEDAELAAARGVDGIVVSNHGGRQLDGAPATLDVLEEVAQAAAGRCEIYLDGGVRRGSDVLKALALGARAVFVGRPVLWGLAAAGEAGVLRVLEMLRDELELAMVLAGKASTTAIDRATTGA
jgi:4-hydroxymandelate oxidase